MQETKYEPILSAARELVEPSAEEEERITDIAKYVMKRVGSTCKRKGLTLKPILAGSFAKGTWIAGDADIDIFIKVPTTLTKDELGRLGIEIGKAALRGHSPYLRYSEHPYVEAWVRGVKVNVVGCYDVPKGEWISAADRSPYHTDLVRERFDERMRREARILKRFLKGLGIYGAEIKTRGFSGYLAEVLVLKYGTFLKVLKSISKIRFGDGIVQAEEDMPFLQLHRTPLIVLDPVDPRRNLGAAISKQRLAEFILGASLFLELPALSFFEIGKFPSSPKKEVIDRVAVVVFTHQKRTVDKLWGQLNKSVDHLEKHLIDRDFRVLRSIATSDDRTESAFIFLFEETDLPDMKERLGPETTLSGDSLKFIEANKDRSEMLWVAGDGRIHSLLKRETRRAEYALGYLLGNGIGSSGISAGLREEVRRNKQIIIGKQISRFAQKRKWLKEAVSEVASTGRIIACCG